MSERRVRRPPRVTTQTVTSYTNPVTGATSQTTVWWSDLSQVPLLRDPRNTSAGGHLPGGWSGCVYARYVGGEATPGTQNSRHQQRQHQ